jgi:hypothetical protein
MLRNLFIAFSFMPVCGACAQKTSPNPQIVIQEIAKRHTEEMQKGDHM